MGWGECAGRELHKGSRHCVAGKKDGKEAWGRWGGSFRRTVCVALQPSAAALQHSAVVPQPFALTCSLTPPCLMRCMAADAGEQSTWCMASTSREYCSSTGHSQGSRCGRQV